MEIFRKIGSWLFLIGIIIAVIAGIAIGAYGGFEEMEWDTQVATILAALGFVIGVFSFFAIGTITKERVPTFLIGALMLTMIGALGSALNPVWTFGEYSLTAYFEGITTCIAVFIAPAAGLLAIRAIWDAGKTEEIEKVIPKIPVK